MLSLHLICTVLWFERKIEQKEGILKSDSEIKYCFIFCPRTLQIQTPGLPAADAHPSLCLVIGKFTSCVSPAA